MSEATYSNRDGSGASFTFVTNRDGSIVQCLDPVSQTPWTNGDVNQPSARVQRIMSAHPGHNFNEFCFMTCENVAYLDRDPINAKQQETLAQLVAWGSKVSGLPINRDTVLGHRDINSVTRHNCPTTGDLDKFLGGIIARAKAIVGGAIPDTSTTGEDPAVINELKAEIADLKDDKARMWDRIKRMQTSLAGLRDQLADTADDAAQLEQATISLGEKHAIIRRLRDRVEKIKLTVAQAAEDVANG
jgi:hypothetical protein